uniref:Uncharacterized protein n=1 Tax=Syphacia muris TaxID=451379 RepID=A0A0N5B0C9_9BILA
MELRISNNNQEEERQASDVWSSSCQDSCIGKVRPKRDFRFQVIQVRQGPKWFIWPSRRKNKSEEDLSKANNNNVSNNISANVINATSTRHVFRTSHLNCATSEPTTRRLSSRTHKAKTEPIATASSSNPSSTFKILSISKKWDNIGNTDDELDDVGNVMIVSCRHLSRNLNQPSQPLSTSLPNSANQVR